MSKKYKPKPEEWEILNKLLETDCVSVEGINDGSAGYIKERFNVILRNAGIRETVVIGSKANIVYMWLPSVYPFRNCNSIIMEEADKHRFQYNPNTKIDRVEAVDKDRLDSFLKSEEPSADITDILQELIKKGAGKEKGEEILNNLKGESDGKG